MGKAKKFIDKKHATTYHVVHRGAQDAEHGVSEEPSERVLPATLSKFDRDTHTGGTATHGLVCELILLYRIVGRFSRRYVLLEQGRGNTHEKKKALAQVTERGFANDGYDYTKHLSTIGGGSFVGLNGVVGETIALPKEALANDDFEIAREYEAARKPRFTVAKTIRFHIRQFRTLWKKKASVVDLPTQVTLDTRCASSASAFLTSRLERGQDGRDGDQRRRHRPENATCPFILFILTRKTTGMDEEVRKALFEDCNFDEMEERVSPARAEESAVKARVCVSARVAPYFD